MVTGTPWLDPSRPGPAPELVGLAVGPSPGAAAATVSAGLWSAAALSCAGLALLLWPAPPRRPDGRDRRTRRGRSTDGHRVPWTGRGWAGPVVVTAAAAATAGLLSTTAAAVAIVLIGGVTTVLARAAATDRRGRRDLLDLTRTLRLMARELRAGASPESAVAAALAARSDTAASGRFRSARGADPRGRVALILRDLTLSESAAGAPVGDRSAGPPGTSRSRTRPEPIDELTVRLTGGWRLATRTGLPLTRLVDAVVAVAQERAAALDDRRAEVAGPRLSGWVLAALPLMGLLLGSGMGVDPLAVLLAAQGWGPVLLVTGTGLTVVGLLWSARIVRR